MSSRANVRPDPTLLWKMPPLPPCCKDRDREERNLVTLSLTLYRSQTATPWPFKALTSLRVMPGGPEMFHTTPVAFSMPMSSNGDEMAICAATAARSLPACSTEGEQYSSARGRPVIILKPHDPRSFWPCWCSKGWSQMSSRGTFPYQIIRAGFFHNRKLLTCQGGR